MAANTILDSVPLKKNQKWTIEEYEILGRNELRLLDNGTGQKKVIKDIQG
jgi:hypothetical protein